MKTSFAICLIFAAGVLLSACRTTGSEALGGLVQGVAEGFVSSVGQHQAGVSNGSEPGGWGPVVPYTPPTYSNSSGSYVDRMAAQSQQRLLNTAPCDPAAREQWRRWVQNQARGNDMGDLYRIPLNCRN